MHEREVKRKLFHVGLGITLVLLLHFQVLGWFGKLPLFSCLFFFSPSARPLFVCLCIGSLLVYFSRTYEIPIINSFLSNFGRPEVLHSFPGKGAFFFLLGSFVVIGIFKESIASTSILILAIGDPISYLIGCGMGKIKNPLNNKTFVEGPICGAVVSALAGMLFLPPFPVFAGSFTAMFFEGIRIRKPLEWILDDNLIVPLSAGFIIFLLN